MQHRTMLVLTLVSSIAAGCNTRGAVPMPAAFQTAALPYDRAAAPVIELDAGSTGPAVSSEVYGASLDTWYDFLHPFVNSSRHSNRSSSRSFSRRIGVGRISLGARRIGLRFARIHHAAFDLSIT